MSKILVRIIAMFMALCTTITGGLSGLLEKVQALCAEKESYVAFADMEYRRPDVAAMEKQLEACLTGAEKDRDADVLLEKVKTYVAMYNSYATNYSLANIRYSMDVTDKYWLEEYNYCLENATEADSGLDELFYALADSTLREELEQDELFGEGFFDDYEGESIWDDTFTALINEENRLETEYNNITAETGGMDVYSEEYYDVYFDKIAGIYVEMISVRQDIAKHRGYDSYPEFAYEYYYDRDYTPEQATSYMKDIARNLADMYWDIPGDAWDAEYETWSEDQTYAYVEQCAKAMGGKVLKSFRRMEAGGYYDISQNANKYDASFETYLWDYKVPFIFMNAQGTGQDPLTFVHEFGHFCNEYASGGSDASIDVAEIFSQAMELLSLRYCTNTDSLAKMQMASLLSVFIFQSIYATFENQVYLLEKDELTVENVRKAYSNAAYQFGFYINDRTFVSIPHFFIAPMYVISYVTSADAALQIFQLEEAETGKGLSVYMKNLDSEEGQFLAFLKSAGLESPFRKGRASEIRKTLEKYIK